MRYIIDEQQIQALTVRVLSGDLRGVIEGIKANIERLRMRPVPEDAKGFYVIDENGDPKCLQIPG